MRTEREKLLDAAVEWTYDDLHRLVEIRVGDIGFRLDPVARTGQGFGGYPIGEHSFAGGVYVDSSDEHERRQEMAYSAFVALVSAMARRWVVRGASREGREAERVVLAYIARHRLIDAALYGGTVEAIVAAALEHSPDVALRAIFAVRAESRFSESLAAAAARRAGSIIEHLAGGADDDEGMDAMFVALACGTNSPVTGPMAAAIFAADHPQWEAAARRYAGMRMAGIDRDDRTEIHHRLTALVRDVDGVQGKRLLAALLAEMVEDGHSNVLEFAAGCAMTHGLAEVARTAGEGATRGGASIAAMNNEAGRALAAGDRARARKLLDRVAGLLKKPAASPQQRAYDRYFYACQRAALLWTEGNYGEALPVAQQGYEQEEKILKAAAFQGRDGTVYSPSAATCAGAWAYFSTLTRLGRNDEAAAAFEKYLDPRSRMAARLAGHRASAEHALMAGLCIYLEAGGGRMLARMKPVLAKVEKLVPEPQGSALAYAYACAHARLGDRLPALDWLEKAVAGGHSRDAARADADLASIRDARRFKKLIDGR